MRPVLFDVDGVLIDGYSAQPERQVRWDATMATDLGVDPDRFREEFIYGVFVERVITGRLSIIQALEQHLPHLGFDGSPMTFLSYWLTRDSHLNPELLSVVKAIKARGEAKLYIVTNQEHMRAFWLWETLGLNRYFDDILYSARLGVTKPDPRFYELVDRYLPRSKEPPLFFDDSDAVIEGALAHGWEAVLFTAASDASGHPWVASRI